MADTLPFEAAAPVATAIARRPRHPVLVRITHWSTTLCFFALLVSGIELVISHPRFYWGEAGNVNTPALFQLPIPASRGAVKTGYAYVLPDQNGWSRSLHFQSAWLLLFTAASYGLHGFLSGHFRRNLMPSKAERSWTAISSEIANHLRMKRPAGSESSYNTLQRLTYLAVIFALFPLMIWTGLAMSPAFTSAFPFTVTVFGGQQSARTIHFFVTLFLTLFVVVHVVMIVRAGFRGRMRGMIVGDVASTKDQE